VKDYLAILSERFPIRRTPAQKDALIAYVTDEAKAAGLPAEVECLGKHRNLVIGDVATAEVLVTAHYDTPAGSLIPNLMLPRNPGLSLLYQLGIPVLLAFLSLGVAYGITRALSLGQVVFALLYLLLYFGLFFGLMRRGANPNNRNDNTSGVATVLTLLANAPERVAYILFDNEEQGLLGSKAYRKAHPEATEHTLVINLDCVGNGEHLLLIAKENAEAHRHYRTLCETMTDGNGMTVHVFPANGSRLNTDYKNFPCGVSLTACRQAKAIFYTPYIHTVKDTVADSANIAFLADRLLAFAKALSEAAHG